LQSSLLQSDLSRLTFTGRFLLFEVHSSRFYLSVIFER